MRCHAVGVILLSLALVRCGERERPPLNVILITLDTTRADHLGCYGSRAGATPAIDRLAARGVRFEHADSVVPLTLPSHATLLTGLLPQRHGLRVNGAGTLRGSVETLATVFSRHGFRTGAFVGSSILDHRFGLARGFGVYDDAVTIDPQGAYESLDAERAAGAVADVALGWLRRTGPRPFFAWIHFYDAHAPYAPPKPYRSRFASSPYDGEIAYADSQVARILDFLDRAGLRDHTIVVIAGDHGEGLGDHDESTHGLLLYESTLHVPLIIAAPGLRAHVVHESVSTTDVAPTLAALAGVPMNVVRLDGRDLSANLIQQREPAPRDIYAETQYPRTFGWSDLGTLRREGKKLISGKLDELFDLNSDPHETTNIVQRDRGTYRELAAAMTPFRRRPTTRSTATDGSASEDPRSMTAQFREFESATALLKAHDVPGALPRLRSLVKENPNNPAFQSALGRAYELSGDHDAALRTDRDVVALAPNDAGAWFDLAVALMARGEAKEAQSAIEESLRLDSNRPDAHNVFGILLEQSGQNAAAATEFRKAIAIDPRSARRRQSLIARPAR